MENNKQAYEINRLRQELGCSPRNNFNTKNHAFKSESFQLNPMAQGCQDNYVLHSKSYDKASQLLMKHKPSIQNTYMESMKPKDYDLLNEGRSA